jgi:hypothetical protein
MTEYLYSFPAVLGPSKGNRFNIAFKSYKFFRNSLCHQITCNFGELANEMEGLAISYYFVIGDPKKMTIWTTCHKMG